MTDELQPLTPADRLALYLDDMQAEYSDATLYGKRSRLQHLIRWCDEQGIDNLNDLTGRKLIRHVSFHVLWKWALRRGALVATDVEDYSSEEQYLHIQHRPDQGTPIKNKAGGERMIALGDASCELLDAWIDEIRPDTTDDYGRNPLISTPRGRAHPGTIQYYVYNLTKPCFTDSQCPYDREVDECDAARTKFTGVRMSKFYSTALSTKRCINCLAVNRVTQLVHHFSCRCDGISNPRTLRRPRRETTNESTTTIPRQYLTLSVRIRNLRFLVFHQIRIYES